MKKIVLLLAFAAISTAASAQTETKTEIKDPVTGAKTTTEVDVRDNGTMKMETETRTGRTEAGEVIQTAGDDVKDASKKSARAVKRAGRKTGHVAKRGAQKTAHGVKKASKAVKNKAQDVVD
jgi:hypothetical protein